MIKCLILRFLKSKLTLIVLLPLFPTIMFSQFENGRNRIISIDQMIQKKKNTPKQKNLLIKFKKEYTEKDKIVVEEFSGYFKITIEHQGTEDYTGGAECYKLDKKTGEKKMLWHEHPMKLPEIEEEDNE